ncbi:hypothetical protein GN956_G7125 [Arapaima gigas]
MEKFRKVQICDKAGITAPAPTHSEEDHSFLVAEFGGILGSSFKKERGGFRLRLFDVKPARETETTKRKPNKGEAAIAAL